METNSDDQSAAPADDASATADTSVSIDEHIVGLKEELAGVEPEKADEPAETEETEETPEETEEQSDDQIEATFEKEFPQIKGETPEEYAKNLEAAYKNSTAEALRLKGLQTQPKLEATQEEAEDTLPKSIVELYAEQQMQKGITQAWTDFSKDYDEINDTESYDKFVKRVATTSKVILADEQRLAEPAELYATAAASLGWKPKSQPTESEKVGMALKEGAAATRTNSATKRKSVSKVTPEMISLNRKLYPGKSDAQIREELEPHVL